MRVLPKTAGFWIVALLTIGTALALGLLAQTAINYRYVSNNLIQQEARRAAEDAVRAVERGARLSRAQDPAEFLALLDELRLERADQVAWIVLRQGGGAIIAASGPVGDGARAGASRPVGGRGGRLAEVTSSSTGRDLFIGDFPCRCGPPGDPTELTGRPPAPSRRSLEIALYRDSLSAPFARLRRDALVSASSALVLLFALLLIALRFGPYVRGKQLEVQVDLAREVQRDLLPRAESLPRGLDVAAECLAASTVGGDFYDIITLPDDRVAFVVGDVSGHGIAAALLMGLIHGAMSGPPWGVSDDEADRATRLNHLLLTKSSAERFASLFWCAFHPDSGTLRYINAGHPPPILIRHRAGGTPAVHRLSQGGPVLGLLEAATYRVESIQAGTGDVLVLFSDGLVEAANDREEFFGEDRLIATALAGGDLPARAICDAILSAVKTFSGDRPLLDDQTLLVVRLP